MNAPLTGFTRICPNFMSRAINGHLFIYFRLEQFGCDKLHNGLHDVIGKSISRPSDSASQIHLIENKLN